MCFTETHLDQNFPMSDIVLNGFYPPIYKNRTNAGGGVLIFVKSHLVCTERQDLSHPFLEAVWVEIISKKTKYLIGNVYRPPSTTPAFWGLSSAILESPMNSCKHLIILGDFNKDLLNANLHNLKDLILLNNLRNLILEPTRITDTSSTLLDPIFISDEFFS